ncbi:hypothetical protein [Edaphobacter flagellatus]|uniref:hypothetical protein n=1 Tax=Edaphobacter flagellatus TaxID=1933044 RepID=UPI0021B36C8A|nr:hypothetical protein [Edaphobacter flagellatus]
MFKPHAKSEERKRSATVLIKYLLTAERPEALPEHYRELLTVLLWKITEAESKKYDTRFQSEGAVHRSSDTVLRHEHVFQRKKMIAELENASVQEVDDILAKAVGCTVTLEEHVLLSKFDDDYGWDRYRKAGIRVVDTQTSEQII